MYDELYAKLRPLLSQEHPPVGELMALRYELAWARGEAMRELYEARPNLLRPKDRETTDLDRRVQMDAWCAEKQRDHQFLDDLWVIVSDIVKTGETDNPGQSHEGTD